MLERTEEKGPASSHATLWRPVQMESAFASALWPAHRLLAQEQRAGGSEYANIPSKLGRETKSETNLGFCLKF